MSKYLSVHYIGGRCGNKALPISAKFLGDVSDVFYEADKSCLDQIKANQSVGSKTHILPYCLSDTCKSIPFNINYDPFTSSIYKINPEYNSYCSFVDNRDYIISEVTKVMETRQIDTVTLDSIVHADGIPLPDMLNIDTQGSEYDILVGASETLKSNVVAIIAETVFHPIYETGIVFGDLVKLMGGKGFHFARFLSMDDASPFRGSIGLRGQGFHMSADTLFLRKLETIEDELMLWKLAFISIIFGQFEYGLACLRKSKGLPKAEDEPTYIKFLRELELEIPKMQEVFPHTFADEYPTFEESNGRFIVGYTPQVKTLSRTVDESVVTQGWTSVESVLNRYGLELQANLLRRTRVAQMRTVMFRNG